MCTGPIFDGRTFYRLWKYMGPNLKQQKGPTPKEGSLQPSCYLIQKNEDYAEPAADLERSARGKFESLRKRIQI